MNLSTIGIDLAKSVFLLHGIDDQGQVRLCKTLSRGQMLRFFANLDPCLLGMEVCGSAHHWARQLRDFGHTVKLISPQFVTPYRKGNKTDGNDAMDIYEAVTRSDMRFVTIKTTEQQALLMVHRIREQVKSERTALINQVRGLLAEFGLVIPQGAGALRRHLPGVTSPTQRPDICLQSCPLVRHAGRYVLINRYRSIDFLRSPYNLLGRIIWHIFCSWPCRLNLFSLVLSTEDFPKNAICILRRCEFFCLWIFPSQVTEFSRSTFIIFPYRKINCFIPPQSILTRDNQRRLNA